MEYYLNKDGSRKINSLLYKYATINQNFYALLINNEMWFSNPLDFNDPYDCNLCYDLSNITYERVHSYLSEANLKRNDKKTDSYIVERANAICKDSNETEKLLGDLSKTQIKDRGISCFSESDSILLMWSHYADSHRGVCLTFNMEEDNRFFNFPCKVEYPDVYPFIDPFDNSTSSLQVLFATKSNEWCYEKEVRIIKSKSFCDKFRGSITFKSEALTEIKFGYKTSNEQIKTIQNLVKDKYQKIKLYRSIIKQKDFGIEFHEIK